MTDATSQFRPYLVLLGGELTVPGSDPVPVGLEPLLVGRDPSCGVVLADPHVSAMHLEVRGESNGVRLTDLGSRNGTRVNGVRVREAILDTACSIQLGDSTLSFAPSRRSRVDVGFSEQFGPLVGGSPRVRYIFRVLREVAPTDLGLLVLGETGTGKELVAQAVHEASNRASGPFVVVDCASIPGPLAESLLFGHERGAFTGASERKNGAFHEANGGTLFLDELGELPVDLQPKLLRALAERKIKRVGSQKYEAVDVRVISATRRDLSRMVTQEKFRSDLFFRVSQVRVELPPLRERREDVPVIVATTCERLGVASRTEDVQAMMATTFARHDWPGNVRELTNMVAVAASLPPGSAAVAELLSLERGSVSAPTSKFTAAKLEALAVFERQYFGDLLAATSGNVSEIARRCGLARHQVRTYLRKYQLALPAPSRPVEPIMMREGYAPVPRHATVSGHVLDPRICG